MADLADVMDAMASIAYNGCYVPPLPSAVTVTGKPISVGQGWPLAEDIDKAMKAGRTLVTVYNVGGAGGRPPQVFDWVPDVVRAPAPGITITVDDTKATFDGIAGGGDPTGRDPTGLLVDGKLYSYSPDYPEVAGRVADGILQKLLPDYPAATVTKDEYERDVLTVPSCHSLVARVGGVGTLAQKVHRQTAQIRIVTWSPNPAHRARVCSRMDVLFKRDPKIRLADGYSAIVSYLDTNLDDARENAGVYRRDLIYTVLYDTIDEFEGTEILEVDPGFHPQGLPS